MELQALIDGLKNHRNGAASPAAYVMSVLRDMAEHGERSIVAYRRRIAKEGI